MPVTYSLEELIGRASVARLYPEDANQADRDRDWAIGEIARLKADNERLHGLLTDSTRQLAEYVREELP